MTLVDLRTGTQVSISVLVVVVVMGVWVVVIVTVSVALARVTVVAVFRPVASTVTVGEVVVVAMMIGRVTGDDGGGVMPMTVVIRS